MNLVTLNWLEYNRAGKMILVSYNFNRRRKSKNFHAKTQSRKGSAKKSFASLCVNLFLFGSGF